MIRRTAWYLYRRFGRWLSRYSDELYQVGRMAAWSCLTAYDPDRPLPPFLKTNIHRKMTKEAESLAGWDYVANNDEDPIEPAVPEPDYHPSELAQMHRLASEWRTGDFNRELWWRNEQGESLVELAKELGISRQAVHTRVDKARGSFSKWSKTLRAGSI